MAIITLQTDFGTQDEYVGVLKGVILAINPRVTIVDVTHGISPHNVVEAAYSLKSSFSYFPEGTVHLAIVDPGVGTRRAIIALQFSGHLFIAPDNGLLSLLWSESAPQAIFRVENEDLFRHPVSRTFHGRDVFAPVAAHLSQGLAPSAVGRPLAVGQARQLSIKKPQVNSDGELEGQIVAVDRFGNLITNIGEQDLVPMGSEGIVTWVGDHHVDGLAENYAQGMKGKPLAIIGSRGCLEIAVNGGNAARILNALQGTVIRVTVNG